MSDSRRSWLFVTIGIVFLAIIHQDLWWWQNRTLVFGFLPLALAYHALYSIMAATLWALTVKFAWPGHIEAWADATDDDGETGQSGDAT